MLALRECNKYKCLMYVSRIYSVIVCWVPKDLWGQLSQLKDKLLFWCVNRSKSNLLMEILAIKLQF